MARIRTIKPEFWADEKLSLLDPLTRLVFLGLISMADDAGRLVDNIKLLDGMLFPNTDDTCGASLEILARISRIARYRSSSGQQLIQIVNWATHQKVDNPGKYTLPGPETAVLTQPVAPTADIGPTDAPSTEPAADSAPRDQAVSLESRENQARTSRSDLLPTTSDLLPPTYDPRPTTGDPVLAATIRFCTSANQGLAEHPSAPQKIPRIMATNGSSRAATEEILNAGVPIEFGESRIFEIGKSHSAKRVSSLKYFTEAVTRAWEEHRAAIDAQSNAPPNCSTANPRSRPRVPSRPPQQFNYSTPTESTEAVKWQTLKS